MTRERHREDRREDRRADRPDFAHRGEAFEEAWRRLAPPPEVPAPDLGPLVLAELRREAARRSARPFGLGSTRGSRVAAAALLVLGVTFGLRVDDVIESSRGAGAPAVVDLHGLEPELEPEFEPEFEPGGALDLLPDTSPPLAETYWLALQERVDADGASS